MANNIWSDVKDIVIAITPIALGYFIYLQHKLNKKQDLIQKQTDGKMNELLEVSKSASLAQGKLEGIAANNPEIKDLSKEDKTVDVKDTKNLK